MLAMAPARSGQVQGPDGAGPCLPSSPDGKEGSFTTEGLVRRKGGQNKGPSPERDGPDTRSSKLPRLFCCQCSGRGFPCQDIGFAFRGLRIFFAFSILGGPPAPRPPALQLTGFLGEKLGGCLGGGFFGEWSEGGPPAGGWPPV